MRFVPTQELQLGTVVSRDIIFTAQNAAMLKKGTVLNERYIEYLQSKGYLGAYVTDELSADIEIPETVDQRLFQDGVEAVMEEKISDVLDISTGIVEDIYSKENLCADLIDLRSFDDYTYHHSVNVAVFSVLVGKFMKLSQQELIYICQAGLLHDLGKSKIAEEILNKPDKLTDEEYTEMKKHAQYSFDMIANSFDVNAIVKQAVLCHHENENGSGYPNGREGSELSLLSKIIHVVDVYDALTSKRPYKEPYEPIKAIDYIKSGRNIQFNSDVIDALENVFPPYPVGVDVYLSDGRRALVIDHSKNKIRPIIRLADTKETVDLDSNASYKDIYIARSGLIASEEEQGKIHVLNEDRSAVKLIRKKVFVIDSNRKTRMQIESILGEDSIVETFESGFDAVDRINQQVIPDLVILDTSIPIMDGFAVINKMRNESKKNIFAIFYTSDNSKDTILKARRLPNTDYILKPANPVYIKERTYNALYNFDN